MLNHPDSNEEWLARQAVWRDDWDAVAAYVNRSSVSVKMYEILESDAPGPHRWVLALGVYTSYGIEFKDIDYLKSLWREALELYRKHYPEYVEECLEYWKQSVLRFYEIYGTKVEPEEFGF